jgi:hypothetical protein
LARRCSIHTRDTRSTEAAQDPPGGASIDPAGASIYGCRVRGRNSSAFTSRSPFGSLACKSPCKLAQFARAAPRFPTAHEGLLPCDLRSKSGRSGSARR